MKYLTIPLTLAVIMGIPVAGWVITESFDVLMATLLLGLILGFFSLIMLWALLDDNQESAEVL